MLTTTSRSSVGKEIYFKNPLNNPTRRIGPLTGQGSDFVISLVLIERERGFGSNESGCCINHIGI